MVVQVTSEAAVGLHQQQTPDNGEVDMDRQHTVISMNANAALVKSGGGTQAKAEAARAMKYLSLVSLTLQNAINSILIRYTRVRVASPADRYSTATVIFWSEVVKLIVSSILVVRDSGVDALVSTVTHPKDTMKVSVPSFVYVVQNNLLFIAASNLDVSTYQISYQMKILTTAVFFVIMLRRKITRIQWASLFILTVGVGLVQLAQVEQKDSQKLLSTDDRVYGFVCIFAASCLSGFAGVYFEKILKGTPASVWLRNVQLALVSVPFALITCYVSEGSSIRENGFHHGYDALVWLVIVLTSLGGLIVAVVIKYADNILKGFATSIAIVIGCVANIFLFGVELNLQFLVGTTLVVSAVWLYG